jgi:hypothetical protein
MLLMPFLLAAVVIPYLLGRGGAALIAGLDAFTDRPINTISLFAAFLLAIVAHELLHGIGWALTSGRGWGPVSFGFKSMSPYCHYDVPMRANAYRFGAALPLIALGITPAAVSVINGNIGLLIFAGLMTISAGGDVLVLWLLRDVPGAAMVQDHPSEVGCRVFVETADSN